MPHVVPKPAHVRRLERDQHLIKTIVHRQLDELSPLSLPIFKPFSNA
jgi:hypothetical protein